VVEGISLAETKISLTLNTDLSSTSSTTVLGKLHWGD